MDFAFDELRWWQPDHTTLLGLEQKAARCALQQLYHQEYIYIYIYICARPRLPPLPPKGILPPCGCTYIVDKTCTGVYTKSWQSSPPPSPPVAYGKGHTYVHHYFYYYHYHHYYYHHHYHYYYHHQDNSNNNRNNSGNSDSK